LGIDSLRKEIMSEDKPSYYQRHREHILEYERNRRVLLGEQGQATRKHYNHSYYEKNKERIHNRQRERRAAARVQRAAGVVKPAQEVPKASKPPAETKPKVNRAKVPRQYYTYVKEEETFGMPQKAHQKSKLLETCPQGFFQPPPSSNPFVLTFS
jgi:hypothetical protein